MYKKVLRFGCYSFRDICPRTATHWRGRPLDLWRALRHAIVDGGLRQKSVNLRLRNQQTATDLHGLDSAAI